MILRTYALYALSKRILLSLAALWVVTTVLMGLVMTMFGRKPLMMTTKSSQAEASRPTDHVSDPASQIGAFAFHVRWKKQLTSRSSCHNWSLPPGEVAQQAIFAILGRTVVTRHYCICADHPEDRQVYTSTTKKHYYHSVSL
jgi:hypothetical protein